MDFEILWLYFDIVLYIDVISCLGHSVGFGKAV